MPRRYFYYLVIIGCLSYILVSLIRYDPPPRGPLDSTGFAHKAQESVDRIRKKAGLTKLELSQQLQDSLAEYVGLNRLDSGELEDVFAHVERSLPQVHELAVNLVYNAREEQLLSALDDWDDLEYGQHTHYASWIFRDEKHRRLGCLSVLARTLPRLELPIRVDVATPMFFDQCRLCGEGHAISLARQAQNTLVVTCPHCDRPYNLIATDADGEWRRATQFFGGLQVPKLDPDLTRREQLLKIWADVAEKCQYKTDAQRVFGSDSWELPIETWRAGHGDCEDSSLLLVEMLTANGFEARVALGQHKGEGHAWCVVRLDDESFLLESTWENVNQLSEIPKLEGIAMNYEPKFLFDHDSLFVLRDQGWTGDYWSEKRWVRINYGKASTVEQMAQNAK
ncbi:MAG: putative transglutaminase-like cysteine proteinase [Verrucomicrobiales bacterium]|jgi:predicted transglutaminase-like cysteine proteinase